MWTKLWMIKINKEKFEYNKFIQEFYPNKILSKWNIFDKYFKDRYNKNIINIHILRWNTYIYDWNISEILLDEKNIKSKNLDNYFKYSKVCSLYKYDFNNSIWYSFYNQWKLVAKEELSWEQELDKLNIDEKLSYEEQDSIIEKFDSEIFSKKYSDIHNNIVNIERENFKYSDIAEEWWDKILKEDEIIIKNKYDDIKILLKHYLLFNTNPFTSEYKNNNIIFYLWLSILFIISWITFYINSNVVYLSLILLQLYLISILVFKKFNWNSVTQNIAIIFWIFFWLMILHGTIYTLMEIIKIKFI